MFCGIPFYLLFAVREFARFSSLSSGPACGASGSLFAWFSSSKKCLERREGATSSWVLYLRCDIESKMMTTMEMLKYSLREWF